MKKCFFYAAAALAMLAGCQKTSIPGGTAQVIDDSKPAAIVFGVDSPVFSMATKAAVDKWNNNEVYVFGIKQERDDTDKSVKELGTGMYDFSDILIDNYLTHANPQNLMGATEKLSALEVYADKDLQMPYYYSEGETYDFFGYHLGGADTLKARNIEKTDIMSYEVKFDGSNDIMYAYTNRANDINAEAESHGVLESDLYSAWAARRGANPTLQFCHALTRFNFIIKGQPTAVGQAQDFQKVIIKSISLPEMATTGTLTVIGPQDALGLVAHDDATEDEETITTLKLKTVGAGADGADGDFVEEPVLLNEENLPAGNGSCLMIAPGLDKIKVVIECKHSGYDGQDLPNYEFEVAAGDIKGEDGNKLGLTEFAAGSQYNIFINVYGPNEIKIEAALMDWVYGGHYDYDSDVRPGGAQKPSDETVEFTSVTVTQANLAAGASEDDYKNALPETYVNDNPYTDAVKTFPWAGVKFETIPANTKICITVDGVYTINLKAGNWPADAVVKGNTVTCTPGKDFSYVGFEVKDELGLSSADGIAITVSKVK